MRTIKDVPCEVCISDVVQQECLRRKKVDTENAKLKRERDHAVGVADARKAHVLLEADKRQKAEARIVALALQVDKMSMRTPTCKIVGRTLVVAGVVVTVTDFVDSEVNAVQLFTALALALIGGGLEFFCG